MSTADKIVLPADYIASRARFRELAARLGAEQRSFLHDADPLDGGGLSTDTAYLGPRDAGTIIVIASGTHGVEGYAGAACQFHFMQTWHERPANGEMAFLLVHAVNPWGFLHDRRVTGEGVDLNRNFVDFPAPGKASGYADYHAMLVGRFRPLPRGLWNEARLLSCALTRKRRRDLQAAITAGQYDHPDGLFYGGDGPTRSRRVWEEICSAYLSSPALRTAFLLDLHTGLGRRGSGELISTLAPSDPAFREMSDWFGGSLKSMAGGESVSAAVQGTLTAAFDRSFTACADARSYTVGLEFGTCSALAVLNALRYDHWYHNNAQRLSKVHRERARRKMKNAFTVSDWRWMLQILTRFDEVIVQLVTGLSK